MKRSVALLLLLALALAGCGAKEETVAAPQEITPVRVLLDWFPNADHAGLYAADWRAAGLDVELQTPTDPSAGLKLLAARKADLAITYESELLLARAQGQRLLAVAAVVSRPLNSIISLEGEVEEPADLEGKKVGITGTPADEAALRAVANRAGIDEGSIERVRVGYNLAPALLSGKVDAIIGAYFNVEGVELERRGEDPTILRLDETGVPPYDELVLVAREETVRSEGPLLRRFLVAAARGHQLVRRDPAAGVRPLLEANKDLREEIAVASLEATIPTFFDDDRGRPWGWMDEEEWKAYAQYLADNELLPDRNAVNDALTTEFLPGEGAVPGEDLPPGRQP